MKTLATLAFIAITTMVSGQHYEQAMAKAMGQMEENLTTAEATFSRIADAEKKQWLPAYYVAYCNVNATWGEKDEAVLIARMTRAQSYLDLAKSRTEINEELLVMQAMINTVYVAYDSQKYGMKLAGPTTGLYAQAMKLAPENPRVVSNSANWSIGSARFFNQPIDSFCSELERALVLFDQQDTIDPLAITWGKKQAEGALKACKG